MPELDPADFALEFLSLICAIFGVLQLIEAYHETVFTDWLVKAGCAAAVLIMSGLFADALMHS